MELQELDRQAVRKQLERVLSSASFARNERLSGFLRFLVERHLEGRDTELKESLIAIEVFGRKPDYDPKQDAIVRTEAVRLRGKLSKYYEDEGGSDPVIIELPKGGYTPVFRHARVERIFGLGTWRWRLIARAGLAVALAALGWWWFQHKSAPVAIAVLPLDNLSHDPANDYFADGLTDEIIRNLSMIDGLAVRSRTSSFAFKGKPGNVREAGRQLEADYILEGSVLRAGQQLRINAQLVRVRDDFALWSGRFDRELTDVLAIQDEISRGIVNSLRLKLGRGRRRYETNVEAYDLYLRGRAPSIFSDRPGRNLDQRIARFEQVITKDPSFAPAWAGLAATYAIRSNQYALDHPADELPKMRAAAETAIQLDPLLAEAHDALGLVYARDGQWKESEKSFRRAIELDPNRSETHSHFAQSVLLVLDRVQEALAHMRVAEISDPLSPDVRLALANLLISAGRYDEAAEHCQKLPTNHTFRSECLGRVRLGQSRNEEAIHLLASDATLPNPGFLGYAYARSGRRDEAEKLLAGLANPYDQTLIFAGLGDKDHTFEALDRMAALGAVRIGRALNSPELSLVRGDPRLKALRKKVGLPE